MIQGCAICKAEITTPRTKYCPGCRQEAARRRANKWYYENREHAIAFKKRPDVVEKKNVARRALPSDAPARVAARARIAAAKKTPEGKEYKRQASAKRRATPQGKAYYRQYVGIRKSNVAKAARILDLDPIAKQEVKAIYEQAVIEGLTVDHFYPLRHKLVSGLHVPWNLRLIPAVDNCRKSNKLPEDLGITM